MSTAAGMTGPFLGRLGLNSLPFWQMLQHPTEANIVNGCIATAAASMVVIGAIVTVTLLTKYRLWAALWSDWATSVDHKKIGIMYVVIAFVMLGRALIEAALMRGQQAFGLSGGFLVARPFCTAVQHPWHHHDFLHGDALPHRHHQLRDADADRGARRILSGAQFRQPRSDGGGCRAGDDIAGDRQVLHRRLVRLSALYGGRLQPRRRAGLLDLGAEPGLAGIDVHRDKFRCHHLQGAGARHDADAPSDVHLDRAVHVHSDDLRDAAPLPLPRRSWRSIAISDFTISPTHLAAT